MSVKNDTHHYPTLVTAHYVGYERGLLHRYEVNALREVVRCYIVSPSCLDLIDAQRVLEARNIGDPWVRVWSHAALKPITEGQGATPSNGTFCRSPPRGRLRE